MILQFSYFLKEQKNIEIDIAQKIADAKNAIQNAQLDNASKAISLLQGLGIKNKGVQKGLLIAESAVGIAKIIINTMAGNAKTIASMGAVPAIPFVIANSISGALGVATTIAATAKGLSALGGGSAGGGSSMPSGGAAAAPPSFNIVGQNSNNQLAQTIAGQQQQPVQAYVVSGNVSSAQSLDRNRIDTATFN